MLDANEVINSGSINVYICHGWLHAGKLGHLHVGLKEVNAYGVYSCEQCLGMVVVLEPIKGTQRRTQEQTEVGESPLSLIPQAQDSVVQYS